MATTITFPDRPQEHTFSNATSVTITHNKNYFPEVQVVLEDGTMVLAEVRHISKLELVVTFINAISGSIYIR